MEFRNRDREVRGRQYTGKVGARLEWQGARVGQRKGASNQRAEGARLYFEGISRRSEVCDAVIRGLAYLSLRGSRNDHSGTQAIAADFVAAPLSQPRCLDSRASCERVVHLSVKISELK